MIAFLSAPFRGANGWEVHLACNRAEAIAAELVKRGVLPISAHTNSRNHHGLQPDAWWLAQYCGLLSRCDFVFMASGWEASFGCRMEHDIAQRRGVKIVYSFDEMDAHLNEGTLQTPTSLLEGINGLLSKHDVMHIDGTVLYNDLTMLYEAARLAAARS